MVSGTETEVYLPQALKAHECCDPLQSVHSSHSFHFMDKNENLPRRLKPGKGEEALDSTSILAWLDEHVSGISVDLWVEAR